MSGPPPSGVMKPKPLLTLKNFTVPVCAIRLPSQSGHRHESRRLHFFHAPRKVSQAQSGPQSVACEPSDVGAAAAFYSHGLCKIRQNRAGFYGQRMGRIKNNEAI